MGLLKHKIKRKVWFFGWWKWIALFLFLMLLLCMLLKCCNTPILRDNGTQTSIPNDNGRYDNGDALLGLMPNRPNLLSPIDTNDIFLIPDDPLGRKGLNNLVNVYLNDTTNIEAFALKVRQSFLEDTVQVSYFAEEYKRVQFKVDPTKRIRLKSFLKEDFEEVKFVVDEWIVQSLSSIDQNDPGFLEKDQSWFYEMIGIFDAWNITMGDSSVKIAVIDDSFDPNHIELQNRLTNPWNVFNYSDRVYSDGEKMIHGTHVAGTVAGNVDNGFGISGVAPHCMIIPIQISDRSGIISISSILDGIFYALKNHADVINLSLALSLRQVTGQLTKIEQDELSSNVLVDEAKMWDEVYRIANEEGTVIVQAAGNDAVLAALDPMKRSRNTIVVGAIDRKGAISNFSNTGIAVTVYAPGVEIYSALPKNEIGPLDGTSMASPIIAGCIGLIKSVKRDISYEEVIRLIESSGTDLDGESGVVMRIDKLLKDLQ